NDAYSRGHMEGMSPGHDPVEEKKKLHLWHLGRLKHLAVHPFLFVKFPAWDEILLVVAVILDRFETQKHQAKERCEAQKRGQAVLQPGLGIVDCQHHHETAG